MDDGVLDRVGPPLRLGQECVTVSVIPRDVPSRWLALAGAAPVLVSACGEPAEQDQIVPLTPFASVPVPLSRNNQVALTDEATACVIDSYEARVFCTGQSDASSHAFGRQGDGPGEFRTLSKVVGSSDGAVGVVDFDLGRLQVFHPTGSQLRVAETRVPSIFTPTAPLASTVVGYRIAVLISGPQYYHLELELHDGNVTWERRYPGSLAGSDCEQEADLYPGTPLPGGGMAFSVCDGRKMAFFADRDDDAPILVPTPTYAEEMPGERDVDQYVAGLRTLFGSEPPSSQWRSIGAVRSAGTGAVRPWTGKESSGSPPTGTATSIPSWTSMLTGSTSEPCGCATA